MYPATTTWNFDPLTLLWMALLLGAYIYALGPLHRRRAPDDATPRWRIVCFVSGWVLLLLTLISPLDTLGRYYLFSAHAMQLFIIITAGAPLLLLGAPEWLVWVLLPTRALRNATRGLLFTVIATVSFNALVLIWHVGPIYEAGLSHATLHNLENFSFVVAGVLTWWPLLTPLDHETRLASPSQILYLVVESLPLDVFGAFTLFAQQVFYHTYDVAPRVLGLSALSDQAAGGAIIAVPGNVIDIILMSMVFFGWIRNVETQQRERERLQYAEEDAAGVNVASASGEAQR